MALAAFRDDLEDEVGYPDNWMQVEKKSDFERVSVLNLPDNRHLRNLRLPLKSRSFSANSTLRMWQYIFVRHVANVLVFGKGRILL